MARLVHLDGPPGIGKSTLAARYAAAHPGVLCCDVDRLRPLVGGWQDDFDGVGAIVRPVALAMVRAHLDGGRDVVLPQMLARTTERERFRAAAVAGGHDYVHVLLLAPPGVAAARFAARSVQDPVQAVVRDVVAQQGGATAIERLGERLSHAADEHTVVVDAGGAVEATYATLLALLGSG